MTGTPLSPSDQAALRELIESYAFAVDHRDRDWFVSLWTPDARLTVHQGDGPPTSDMRGHEALGEVTTKIAVFPLTLHVVSNHRCVEHDGVVTGEAYCIAHHLRPTDEGHDDLVMGIRYLDRYRREASGRWYFEERQCRKQWERHEAVRGYLPSAQT